MATGVVAIPEQQPCRDLWQPVTVRVAWELVMAQVRVRPQVLQDAREHVLRCLPEGVDADEAERLASVYTRDFLLRVREHRYRRPKMDPDISLVVPREWRSRLQGVLDPIGETLLRMHYADGHSLPVVEQHAALDRGTLMAAREGVRAASRTILIGDGMQLTGWSDKRLDLLISRISNQAEPGCPGPVGLLSDAGRAHADRCPRCSRAVRLIHAGALSPSDLFLPADRSLVPGGRIPLLAVLLHPDGRQHREMVCEALGGDAIAVQGDAWLVSAVDLSAAGAALSVLAESNTPPRHLLRGAQVTGPGRWSRGTLLGPLPVLALETARARPWSEIDGIGELPPPLPPPPRATRWWALAGFTGLLAVASGALALQPQQPLADSPITAHFSRDGERIRVRFDTDDLAVVDVIAEDDGVLRTIAAGVREDKGRWATREGDFVLTVHADRLALISSQEGITDLDALLETLPAHGELPLIERLTARIKERQAGADVALSPAPPAPVSAQSAAVR